MFESKETHQRCVKIGNGRTGTLRTLSLPLNLTGPSLMIEPTHRESIEYNRPFYSTVDLGIRSTETAISDYTNIFLSANNITYGLDDIIQRGRCQTVLDETFWFGSKPRSTYRYPIIRRKFRNGWQCILHMAKTFEKELKMVDENPTPQMTDRQLSYLVKEKLGGGEISFGADLEYEDVIGLRQWVWSWCKRESF
ncbi:hypothetical protein QBC38DRAFT_448267 [Podospora fimiseda]|uniref:Uncharacterized protein n=1 Tax=Podospora fimiseda TaxID=252190 RepID=A0AAN6YNM9_9PEZI|nr:hypothetical protein QBC38DRAFT_448267 [Podospora fimiseda]